MIGFPGHTYYALLEVRNSSNQLVAADSLPTVQVWHNNSIDGTVTVTVQTTGATGIYAVSFAVPVGYSAYDQVELRGLYSVSSQPNNVSVATMSLLVPATSLPVNTSGLGAYAVTIKATSDGTTPVAGATVRINATGQNFIATSDSNGNANFSVDAATFTVSASLTGFGFSPISLAVDSNGHFPNSTATEIITMAAIAIPAATNPGQTNAYTYTLDGSGNVVPNLTVNFRLVDPQATTDAYARTTFSETSSSIGLLQVTLIAGARYDFQIAGDSTWTRFTSGTTGTSSLPELLGPKV
jgi:hypothetical protein